MREMFAIFSLFNFNIDIVQVRKEESNNLLYIT